jgi:hypothetical protein
LLKIKIPQYSYRVDKLERQLFLKTKTMQRQSIIVFIQGERIETYGNLKKCCEFENLKYHTLARLKFPIVKDKFTIHKTEFK